MRKMVVVLAFLGLASIACRYAYAARTVIECGGTQAEVWADGTLSRLEEMDANQRAANAVLQSSAYLALEFPADQIWLRDELQPYASRAEARYRQQLAQTAPPCLRDMQEITADVFYYDWKTYEAAQHGDPERVAEMQDRLLAATNAVSSEYERLVEKYGWVK